MNFGKVPRAKLPTAFGEFTVYGFRDPDSGEEAVALVAGNPGPDAAALVRIHSQCLTGDVFGSERCVSIFTPSVAMHTHRADDRVPEGLSPMREIPHFGGKGHLRGNRSIVNCEL